MYSQVITEDREDPRLVECHPMLHAIAERVGHDAGVVAKIFCEIAIRPSAGVLERLRQIPMIESHPRLDVALEHLVDDATVEVETLLINRPLTGRHDARPRERNSRRVESEVGHHRDVVGIAMVEIARDVAGIAILNLARRVRKAIPDSLALAVLVPPGLDLIRRAGCTPQKIFRK